MQQKRRLIPNETFPRIGNGRRHGGIGSGRNSRGRSCRSCSHLGTGTGGEIRRNPGHGMGFAGGGCGIGCGTAGDRQKPQKLDRQDHFLRGPGHRPVLCAELLQAVPHASGRQCDPRQHAAADAVLRCVRRGPGLAGRYGLRCAAVFAGGLFPECVAVFAGLHSGLRRFGPLRAV